HMWWARDGRKGLAGLLTKKLPLYGAQNLPGLTPGTTVVLVEGEKACQALLDAGTTAVGTVTGAAGCPSDEVLGVLSGFDVILWVDADKAGRAHMKRIATRLSVLGIAARIMDPWPEATDGRDAADWSGTDEDLRTLLT